MVLLGSTPLLMAVGGGTFDIGRNNNSDILADITSVYLEGREIQTMATTSTDQAFSFLDTTRMNLASAQSAGNKRTIQAAQADVLNAQKAVYENQQSYNQVKALLDRLNVIREKAAIENNTQRLGELDQYAHTMLKSMKETSKHRPPPPIVIPPPPTTTTTQPSPTPVGRIRG